MAVKVDQLKWSSVDCRCPRPRLRMADANIISMTQAVLIAMFAHIVLSAVWRAEIKLAV